MNRRRFLQSATAGAAGVLGAGLPDLLPGPRAGRAAAAAARKPNIIAILADDLG